MAEVTKYEKTMTVKEVAEVFGVSSEAIKKHVRLLYPECLQNGKETRLTEIQVIAIKQRMLPTTKVAGAVTELEKTQTIMKAIQYLQERESYLEAENNRLKQEAEEQKPKIEYMEKLVEKGNSTNFRNTAKELNIPERKFIGMLINDGLVFRDRKSRILPIAEYQRKGYFAVKEWQAGDKAGVQTLVTVKGKEYLLKRYMG